MISQHIFYYFTGGRVWLSHVFASSPSSTPVLSFSVSYIHLYTLSGFHPPHFPSPAISLSYPHLHTFLPFLHSFSASSASPPPLILLFTCIASVITANGEVLCLLTSSFLFEFRKAGRLISVSPAAQRVTLILQRKITPLSGLLAIFRLSHLRTHPKTVFLTSTQSQLTSLFFPLTHQFLILHPSSVRISRC